MELIQLTDNTKTDVVKTVISADNRSALSGTRFARVEIPRPAPKNVEITLHRTRWVVFGRMFVVILSIIIATPFGYIAVDVN